MKILFLTQKIDVNDDLLGFVRGWLQKLAVRVEKISVVALGVGEYHLPGNVEVFSLGKNKNGQPRMINGRFLNRSKYLFNFYKYIWALRKDYDLVFVHMNKEYVILGGIFWRLTSKKIVLWYNHVQGNFWTKLAFALADKIFYTSPFSFAARYKKAQVMPAGIDTELFKKDGALQKIPNSILYLGRISPIKNLETLIETAKILDQRGVDFVLDIVGDAPEKDREYLIKLKNLAAGVAKINFSGKVPNWQAPQVYNQHAVAVNLTNSGSLDKSVLEAMACKNIVVLSNQSFREIVPDSLLFQEKNPRDLSEKLIGALSFSQGEEETIGKKLRNYALNNHSMDILIEKLIENFKNISA